MSLHPANLRAVAIGQYLEGLNDEELVSAMAQAGALLRRRERRRNEERRQQAIALIDGHAEDIRKRRPADV